MSKCLIGLDRSEVDLMVQYVESELLLGRSITEAFPLLRENKANFGTQFSGPMNVANACVRWIWLAVHAGRSPKAIRSVVSQVVERSLAAYPLSGGNYFRPEHDAFIMMAAILLGDANLVQNVANIVQPADPEDSKYQFFEGWVGILKARVLGRVADEVVQLDVLLRKKGLSSVHCPSHRLVQLFCKRDYSLMNIWIRDWFKKEKRMHVERNLLFVDEAGRSCIALRERNPNHLWPWAEATFAKLANLEGVSISTDELWMPAGLLSI